MSAEAKTPTIVTESPPEQSPEAQAVVLTIESTQALIRSAILERFASIGVDAVVVNVLDFHHQTPANITTIEYSAEIGSGSHPWFLETGTATINEGKITLSPEKYFGRQIFATSSDLEEIATDSTSQTPHLYPIYANDDLMELDPGDFFAAGKPDLPGTKILQLAGITETKLHESEVERTEKEGEDGMLRITEIETSEPIEITRLVGKRIEVVAGLELVQYNEPENARDFYRREPLFSPPHHIRKTRGDLAKVRIKKTA